MVVIDASSSMEYNYVSNFKLYGYSSNVWSNDRKITYEYNVYAVATNIEKFL